MKIRMLQKGWMEQSGSSLLKMMQNVDMPSLDLVVRESIQNSLDASLYPNDSSKDVIVKIDCCDFDPLKLAKHFESIEEQVMQKTKHLSLCRALMISDYNTVGLTGKLNGIFNKNESNQNLGKLVFQIMKPQENEGAGGSWGIGKTVYYRIGLGMVIYYSRIKTSDGLFQDRLVAAIVEDENDKDGFLSKYGENNLGVAFFGEEKEDGHMNLQAITDREYISEFLSVFGLSPYKNNDTGTMIIIPFINEKVLLMNNVGDDDDKEWWHNNLFDYLKISILRWYFPRCCRNYLYGPKLIASINNELVIPDVDTAIYKKMDELYNACFCEKYSEWINKKEIIRSQNLKNQTIGWLMFGKINIKELFDAQISNVSSFFGINQESEYNSPVVAYCRKPGMIISYDKVSSIKTSFTEIIVALFVLNSTNYIEKPKRINLDEYFRQSEKSDHTHWVDYSLGKGLKKIAIFNQIKTQIDSILQSTYGEQLNSNGLKELNTVLAHKMAQKFMPVSFFGNSLAVKKAKKYSNNRSGKKKSTYSREKSKSTRNYVNFLGFEFDDNGCVSADYDVFIIDKINSFNLYLQLDTIGKPCDVKTWEENGEPFPFSLQKIMVMFQKYNNSFANNSFFLERECQQFKSVKISKMISELNETYGLCISFGDDFSNASFHIKISIFGDNNLLHPIIKWEEQ